MRSITIATIVAVVVVALLGAAACSPTIPRESICIGVGEPFPASRVYYQPGRYVFHYHGQLTAVIARDDMSGLRCYPIPEGTSYDEIAQRFRPTASED